MNILNKIVDKKKNEIQLIKAINKDQLQQNNRSFIDAIIRKKPAIIAELKSKSPSEGVICSNYHPLEIAKKYKDGGACCISVLTDKTFFNGSFDHLNLVSSQLDIPTLCKDFIIDKKQVHLAREAGASACLLIVRILTDSQLVELKNEIESLGMDVLIEVYDLDDLERALKINPKLIGINNRNLDSLKMDTNNAKNLVDKIPTTIPVIALSGAQSIDHIIDNTKAFDGVLVGTFLMRSDTPDKLIESVFDQF